MMHSCCVFVVNTLRKIVFPTMDWIRIAKKCRFTILGLTVNPKRCCDPTYLQKLRMANVFHYSHCISIFGDHKRWDMAEKAFLSMRDEGVQPNVVTYGCVPLGELDTTDWECHDIKSFLFSWIEPFFYTRSCRLVWTRVEEILGRLLSLLVVDVNWQPDLHGVACLLSHHSTSCPRRTSDYKGSMHTQRT